MRQKYSISNDLGIFHKSDLNLGLVGVTKITRKDIFEVLNYKYRNYLGNLFFTSAELEDPLSLAWIITEDKIIALTEIVAFMCSKKNVRAVGSLSHNGITDLTLRTLIMFPKKKIKISKAAAASYPEIRSDVKKMMKIFRKNRYSMEFAQTKGHIVWKLESMARVQHERIITIVKAFEELKSAKFNKKTPINDQYQKALKSKIYSEENFPIIIANSNKNNLDLLQEQIHPEIIKEFKKIKNLSNYETIFGLRDFLESVIIFIDKESTLNIKSCKPIETLDKYLLEGLDSTELHEYGNFKRYRYLKPVVFSKFPKMLFTEIMNPNFGIRRRLSISDLINKKYDYITLVHGNRTLSNLQIHK